MKQQTHYIKILKYKKTIALKKPKISKNLKT